MDKISKDMQREYLRDTTIVLYGGESQVAEEFRILDEDPLGEGGSCVCYRAVNNGRHGLLKEYYPVQHSVWKLKDHGEKEKLGQLKMERSVGWKLRPVTEEYGEAAVRSWERGMHKYQEPYRILEQLAEEPGGQILNNYLTDAEIFYDEKEGGNLYLWTRRNAVGLTWDRYLREVRKYYLELSERSYGSSSRVFRDPEGVQILMGILKTVRSVALFLQNLHKLGYLYLDMKPENLLILYDRVNHLDPSKVALFDIDTLFNYRKLDPNAEVPSYGTCKYEAPELSGDRKDLHPGSDLYELVSCLYHAVMFPDERDEYRGSYVNCKIARLCTYGDCNYRQQDFEEMEEDELFGVKRIEKTDLFRSIPEPFRTKAAEILHQIFLEIFYADTPDERFDGCREEECSQALIRRLDEILNLLQQSLNLVNEFMAPQARWMVSGPGQINMEMALQNLLYQYPIYQTVPEEAECAEILIVGSGDTSLKFLDFLLPIMQVRRCGLRVTVMTKDVEIRRKWQEKRPAARDFLEIHGEDTVPAGKYGYLEFRYLVMESIDQLMIDHAYSMAFIAWDSDQRNLNLAQRIQQQMRVPDGMVCFVCEDPKVAETAEKQMGLYPVCLKYENQITRLNTDLVKLAFNNHCLWEDPECSEEELLERFYDEKNNGYNFVSSLAAALGFKYKLWDMGVDVSDMDTAARQWHGIVQAMKSEDSDPKKRKKQAEAKLKIQELTALEHRRWVMSKVLDGYVCMKASLGESVADLCVDIGKNSGLLRQGTHLKVHNCILTSTSEECLPEYDGGADTEQNQKFYYIWNREPMEELEARLNGDELDRMNVELHRDLKNYDMTRLCGAENPIHTGIWSQIRQMFRTDVNAMDVLDPMEDAVQKMWECQEQNMQTLTEEEKVQREIRGRKAVKEFGRAMKVLQTASKEAGIREFRRNMMVQSLEQWERLMYPLLEGNTYRYYKAADLRIVRGLAGMLSFRRHQQVAVKVEPNAETEQVLAHLQQMILDVKPDSIIFYLRFAEWADEIEEAEYRLLDLVEGVKKMKDIPCRLKMLLSASDKNVCAESLKSLRHWIQKIKIMDGSVQELVVRGHDRDSMADSCAQAVLSQIPPMIRSEGEESTTADMWRVDLLDDTYPLFRSEEQEAIFREFLNIPCFRYDGNGSDHRLVMTEGCEYLTYIHDAE